MFSLALRYTHFIPLEMGSKVWQRTKIDSLLCPLPHTGKDVWGGGDPPNFTDRIKRQQCVYLYTHILGWVNWRGKCHLQQVKFITPKGQALVWGCPGFLYNRGSSVASCDYSKTLLCENRSNAKRSQTHLLKHLFFHSFLSSATSASFSSDKNWSLETAGPSLFGILA